MPPDNRLSAVVLALGKMLCVSSRPILSFTFGQPARKIREGSTLYFIGESIREEARVSGLYREKRVSE